jgi:hypothetical protein
MSVTHTPPRGATGHMGVWLRVLAEMWRFGANHIVFNYQF